jgi:dienelactone hydrolase
MKQGFFIFLFFLSLQVAVGQVYPVGNSTITLTDEVRNREIPLQVYYPAVTAGQNAAWAGGPFPLIVLGHGFAMNVTAYVNFCQFIVPKGYVVVMVDTENGLFSVSHENYGRDIAFAAANVDFQQTQNQPFAYLGHSMGGGASFIASGFLQPNLLVGWAPAETNPSAIEAAAGVECPLVVFSGSGDAVTPPEVHHWPVYNASPSACKAFVSINGGAHCYFAQSNLACDFGETTAGSIIDISRQQQQDIVFYRMELLLAAFLKDDQESFTIFEESVMNSSDVTGTWACSEIPLGNFKINALEQFLTPASAAGWFKLDASLGANQTLYIYSVNGSLVYKDVVKESGCLVDMTTLSPGVYIAAFGGYRQRVLISPDR